MDVINLNDLKSSASVEVNKNANSGENEIDTNKVELDASISVSQQQNALTSPCSVCTKTTSKKDRVFECSKCKNLTHYSCTRLPGYAIFSLKSTKRQYVCTKEHTHSHTTAGGQ